MTIHDQLPIYDAVIELNRFLCKRVPQLPRGVKAVYGKPLVYEAAEMAVIVRHANVAVGRRKVLHYEQLLDSVERVRVYLRMLREERHLNNPAWEESIVHTVSIGKQATALRNKFAPAPAPAA